MSLNPFKMFRRKQYFARSAERHACKVNAELVLTDSLVTYDGRLINISAGGAMFRPRLSYLMYRRDIEVELRVAGLVLQGTIVATTPAGFGIRFSNTVDPAVMRTILAAGEPLQIAA